MTAHVVYTAWDAERPASLSPTVIGDIIRGRIGFDGWLMSDDLGMEALSGDFGQRAPRASSPPAATSRCIARARWRRWSRSPRGAGDERRRRSAAGAGDGERSLVEDDGSTSPRRSPSATRCWRWSERSRQWTSTADFERSPAAPAEDELTLTLDGWEGPLDLLLSLARAQKVDLAQISILELVEQYLAYIAEARALKLEIAADYLVMAAWLAYLKSCLLLPKDPEADPSPEEIALRLQMRLQRLDAMREAGARLLGRDRIGRDVFVRGAPEGLRLVRKSAWQARASTCSRPMARSRRGPRRRCTSSTPRSVMTLEEALERVGRMLGTALDWTLLESVPAGDRGSAIPPLGAGLELRRRARAGAAGPGRDRAGRGRSRRSAAARRLMDEFTRAVEATLFASAEPLTRRRKSPNMPARATSRRRWRSSPTIMAGRGIELVERGGRWHFQTAPDLAHLLRRTREEPRRLSRAATETLAIIAYHEPVSRAEIEAIRGVQISKGTIDVLMDAGWVRPAGRREGPGRPLLYATTAEFLSHFGLGSRRDLPGIDDLKAAGLLDPLDESVSACNCNWKARRGGLEGRQAIIGVIHGRFQPHALDHPRRRHPAAVRRQPLLGDDGRRRQGPEELQAGHVARTTKASGRRAPQQRRSAQQPPIDVTPSRRPTPNRRARRDPSPRDDEPRIIRARTAADVRRRFHRTDDRRDRRFAVHRPQGAAADDARGRPLGRQDPRHGAPFHRRASTT